MKKQTIGCEATHFPEPFNFYAQMIDGHLHFGYWPENDPGLSLVDAQDILFKMLISYLPSPPSKILDVGCGLGKASLELAEMGYLVTAISPDREMVNYAEKNRNHPNLTYMVVDFIGFADEYNHPERFEAILMQESLQYIRPLDQVFRAANMLLSENGRVVICDEIRQEASIEEMTAVHKLADVIASAYNNFFYIKKREMIGQQVRKTCDEVLHRLAGLKQKYTDEFSDIPPSFNHLVSGWNNQKAWYERGLFDYALIVLIKNNLRIRAYASGDEQEILPAFNQVFNVHRTMQHWLWKFRQNPFGVEKITIAEDFDKKIAAQFSGYPVILQDSLGQPGDYIAIQAGDTMTIPGFRNVGLGASSLLVRVLDCYQQKFCVNQIALMYGFNTGTVRKLGERFLGYEYIRPIPYHILQVDHLTESKWFKFNQTISGYSVECINSLDSDWDSFFTSVSPDYGLLVKRDRKYLQWRYIDCPDKTHVLVAIRKFGKLVGWSVFTQRENVIIWGDAMFDKKYFAAVKILLHFVKEKVFKGIERFEGWFSPVPVWWNRTLAEIGFRIVKEPNDLSPCFMFFDSIFSRDYLDNNFYYTYGDSDLF